MLTLVLRRALVQRRLLGAVVVLVATACTLVGTCTLMLGVTQDRAFHVAIEDSPPADLSVTAFLVDLGSSDITSAGEDAGGVVADVLGPMRPTLETTATSRLRELDGGSADDGSQGYLMATDGLAARADLTSGRWPAEDAGGSGGPAETVVPATTARLLGLDLGDRVTLGRETGLGGVDDPVPLVVVGTFRPRTGIEWERDPLGGSGFSPAYTDGLAAAPTYGPFVVGERALVASGSSVTGLRVTAYPTLELAEDASLRATARALGDASGLLSARVGDRARITRLASELPRSLDRVHAQQASTRSTVLVVLLLGTALSLAAALLAGGLVGSVREDERDLLVAMGLARRQQLGTAAVEALLLSVVSAALAVPAASLVHSWLTHLVDLEAAGLQQGPSVTWGLVLAVLAAAVLLTAALVSTTVRARRPPDSSPRGGALVRHGLDLVLVASAALAWWQLRGRPDTTGGADDVVLTLAPVLCLAALTVLGVRLVPVLLRRAAGLGARSRALVLPMAAQQAARRPHTGTAMALLAAAVAASVLGLALRTTWDQSQDDQAAVRVGTDLALTLPAPAGLREATEVAETVGGQTPAPVVSSVIRRPLALGRYIGEEGSRPVLVAVDTRESGALLRGRLDDGRTWAEVGEGLAPEENATGIPLPDDSARVLLQGRSPGSTSLTVTPTAVVEDRNGFRTSVLAAPLPLDGRARPVRWLGALDPGLRLVGLRLALDGSIGQDPGTASVEVSVSVPATDSDPAEGPDWTVLRLQEQSPVTGSAVAVEQTDEGTVLTTTLDIDLVYFEYTGADVLATAFPVAPDVPVVVSQDLVDAVGAEVGDELSAIVGDTVLVLRVAEVVPTVPSAPGEVAVLADTDTLSRALIDAGRLEPVVDAWWVARPTAATAEALRASELGEVTTREDVATQLAQGPLRVTVPTTLLTLVALAVSMLLAALVLVLSADRQRRTAEVVLLRALGVPRRDVWRLQVSEHLALFVPLVLVGTVVGAGATVLLGPHLVRSDLGAAPVPSAVVAWPWPAEALLLAGLLLGTVAVTSALTSFLVRHAGPTRAGAGEG